VLIFMISDLLIGPVPLQARASEGELFPDIQAYFFYSLFRSDYVGLCYVAILYPFQVGQLLRDTDTGERISIILFSAFAN